MARCGRARQVGSRGQERGLNCSVVNPNFSNGVRRLHVVWLNGPWRNSATPMHVCASRLPPQVLLMLSMLHESPWRYFPLTLQYLHPEYASMVKGENGRSARPFQMDPVLHVCI